MPEVFNLQRFAIHSQLGEFGQFRQIVTAEAGTQHASSAFPLGTYDETFASISRFSLKVVSA